MYVDYAFFMGNVWLLWVFDRAVYVAEVCIFRMGSGVEGFTDRRAGSGSGMLGFV